MKAIRLTVSTVYLLALVLMATPALALTVQIGGVEIPWKQNDSTEPATERALSGPNGEAVSYGCFTIAGLSSTPNPKARVVVVDGNQDTLKIENALIKATSASFIYPCTSDIVAWHTFGAPPGTDPNGIRFYRTIDSEALRGTNGASNNWMKVTGWINGDEIWGYDQRTFCATPHPTCGDFKYTRIEDWLHATKPLTEDREMRLQVWFKMRYTNDIIKMPISRVYTDSIVGTPTTNPNLPGHSSGQTDDKDQECVVCKVCPVVDKTIIIVIVLLVLVVFVICCWWRPWVRTQRPM